ncbi:MAG TPA: nucleotidyltransferase domain-containing protein [Chlamydiales bacterium]|nr:nucleotidyltransferase domain-containing protein [Chlamydiales bacterium]
MFGLKKTDLQAIIQLLKFHPEVKKAIIFGSRAMGNYKAGSDVDIAIQGDVSEETAWIISSELNERLPLPYKFDVVAYTEKTNPDLIKHIDQFGISFYPV